MTYFFSSYRIWIELHKESAAIPIYQSLQERENTMKQCPNCGYTGTDTEKYCNQCGYLMNDVSNSMQSSFYDTSNTYQSNAYGTYEEPAKKKKGKIFMVFVIFAIFFTLGFSITTAFVKNMFMPRSFLSAMVAEKYDKALSYFPDYMAENQYDNDGEEAFESFKENFEYICGDDMKINKYSVSLTKTVTGDDAEETNEFYEEYYDDYVAADKFYCYEGTFTVTGDDDSIDCTFEAIVCKINGKNYLFSINWDEE